jgi:inner membrane transporter RhtA
MLCALAAGVGWALYIVYGQKAGRAHGAAASTWGMIVAACLIVPIGVADAGQALFAPWIWTYGLAVAVFSSALPYTLEMIALRRLSAKTFGTLMSFEPAIGAMAGVALLHEHLTSMQWLAIGFIIAASVGTVSGEP